MAKISEIMKALEEFAPCGLATKGEYNGLIAGDKDALCNKILFCLDVTPEIIRQARTCGAQLIVSHHSLIYHPVGKITYDDVLGRTIIEAIRARLNIYSMHTNLDNADNGINDFLIKLCGAKDSEKLYCNGELIGRTAEITPVSADKIAHALSEALKDKISIIGNTRAINKIAVVCGGGGGDVEYLKAAAESGAQCLITGDIKHHVAMYAVNTGMAMIDAPHFSTEYGYIKNIKEILSGVLSKLNVNIEISKETNPRRLI